MLKWLSCLFKKELVTWEILEFTPYLDTSYGFEVPSVQYAAVSSKGKFVCTYLWGSTLTKEQLLDLLNRGVKPEGRFK